MVNYCHKIFAIYLTIVILLRYHPFYVKPLYTESYLALSPLRRLAKVWYDNRGTVVGYMFRLLLVIPQAYAIGVGYTVLRVIVEYYVEGRISEVHLIHNPCLIVGDVTLEVLTGGNKYTLPAGIFEKETTPCHYVHVWQTIASSYLIQNTSLKVLGFVIYPPVPDYLFKPAGIRVRGGRKNVKYS